MPEAPLVPPPSSPPQASLPKPPVTTRLRSQLEAFLVLRRNTLELWGKGAYEEWVLPGSFLGRKQLMLNQPDAIRHVLVTNAENYGRNVGTRRVLQPVLGEGLFLAEGEPWRHQRRTIAPALAPRTLPVLARHVVTATEAEEAALDGLLHRPVELLQRLQHLALMIAGRSMFSLEMAEHGEALRRLVLRYARRHAQPGILDLALPAHLPTPSDLGRAAFRKDWLRLMDRMIAARRAQPGEQGRLGGQPRDLFDLLSEARDPQTGAGFDDAQLRDEVATLMLAGHETTAVTLFWCCYIAARLPEEQEAVAQETAGVDLSADGAAAALRRLPRTRAFVDETLRLYPPAFLIVREARGPDEVAGSPVAPGTVVSVSPWVLHRHRGLWQDPDRFDPGRFLPGREAPDRYAYLPFGAGPRICVGAQFALAEAVLVLARLLRRYRLCFAGSGEVVPRGFVTTQPDRPVRFLLERRKAS